MSMGHIKHRAFAAGFFGFHYIRATLENAPILRKDSLQRLLQLLEALQIDESFTNNLPFQSVKSLPEFQRKVIKRVSLEIGDAFNSPAQWMVEFGFSLAITYSTLVTTTQCKSQIELKKQLMCIESRIQHLLILAKKSEAPTIIIDALTSSAAALRQRKTRQSTRKCMDLINLTAKQLLITEVAVGVLN